MRSLKTQKIKEITKEKEKKRQENQKNEVIKRKGKNKKRKVKENMKENQQAAVEKSLPGVQARCAVFLPISWAGKVVSSICSTVGMREESRLHEVSKVTLNLFGSRPLIIC